MHAEPAQLRATQDRGFTLVELLIVIVILGVLAAVAVFAVGGVTSTATTNACAVEYKTMRTAVDTYRGVNGADPVDTVALVSGGFLSDSSKRFTVASGEISAALDSGCVVP